MISLIISNTGYYAIRAMLGHGALVVTLEGSSFRGDLKIRKQILPNSGNQCELSERR